MPRRGGNALQGGVSAPFFGKAMPHNRGVVGSSPTAATRRPPGKPGGRGIMEGAWMSRPSASAFFASQIGRAHV